MSAGRKPAPAGEGSADKRSDAWQAEQWRKMPQPADWPGVMDLYEAAAYLRCDYMTVRRCCLPGRDGMARLAHQRVGTSYRIRRSALDNFGAVKERSAA